MKLSIPFLKPKNAVNESTWEGLDGLFNRGARSKAGVRVDHITAYASTAVAACLLIRSETAATLPTDVMREVDSDETGGVSRREKAKQHPAYPLLKFGPNPSQRAVTFWNWQQQTTDILGNAWVWVETRGTRLVGLHPLTGRCEAIIENVGGINHLRGVRHFKGGTETVYPEREILHFPSSYISEDGITGRSLVDVARESIGLDIAAQEFFARVMSNGTHMGVVLVTDESLSKEQSEALQKQLADGRGVAPAGKVRLFQKGVKPFVVGMTVKDAELTEARRFVREGICNVTRIPVVMIDPTHGTYSNSEQGDIQLAKHCIRPIVVIREQVISSKLLSADPNLYVKFDLNGLMRGDFASRMNGYAQAVNAGIFTPNMVLKLEDEEELPGGDILRFPTNSIPATQAETDPLAAAEPIVADAQMRVAARFAADGDTERTRAFAAKVIEPIALMYARAGRAFDSEAFIKEAVNG